MSVTSRRARLSLALIIVGGFVVPVTTARAQTAVVTQVASTAPDAAAAAAVRHTIVETSFAVTDDLHERLGQLIAYPRMNGVKPPWSR